MDFTTLDDPDKMQQQIQANYDHIKQEIREVIDNEIKRINRHQN